MVEINIDMDYLFEAQRINKLQFQSRGLLADDIKTIIDFKYQDGKIVRRFSEIDEPLYASELYNNDLCAIEYIEADEELSDVLNDSEGVIFAEYTDI